MKRCSYCNGVLEDEDLFCRYCGKKADNAGETGEGKGNITSLILKYSAYLDTNALYKIAWAKESGIIRSDYPGEAEDIYKVLAFKGHADSIYRYATLLLSKPQPEKQPAHQWLKIAADAGHVPSINLLRTYDWNYSGETKAHTSVSKSGAKEVESGSVSEKQIEPMKLPEGSESFAAKVNGILSSILMISATEKSGTKSIIKCGSGFILENGYVITNAHVIGRNPQCIEANFEPSVNRRTYPLCPVKIAEEYDIAVLTFSGAVKEKLGIQGVGLNTGPVQYGQEVYTIGNPLGIGLSVSKGIVSCPDRATNYPSGVSSVIQTDITINHGNSGGALFDINNKVIGITTFVPGNSEGGIGMCIPSSYIRKLIENI